MKGDRIMVENDIGEKIEQLASETVIKISNLAQSGSRDKDPNTQRELTKLRLSESRKMNKYFLKVYETFQIPKK